MPTARRIAPQESLEFGFRAAYNQTVDAIIDASAVTLTDAGVLQFYNDLGVLLGEVDLSTVLALANQIPLPNNGQPTSFDSATDETEGVVRFATPDEVAAGTEEFKAVSPAALTYLLELLDGANTFDEVAKRGTDEQKGRTTQLMKLLGGLILDQIPPLPADKTGYGLVWDKDDTKKVYWGNAAAGTASPLAPVLTFGTHYEAVAIATTPPFTVPAGSPPLIGDSRYSGSLDVGSCDTVSGWAKKRDALDSVVSVDIYKNGVKHTTVQANELRGDVADAISPGTNPYAGYRYVVSESDRTGIAIVWSAKIAGTSYELAKSPMTSNVCGIAPVGIKRTFPDGPDELTEGSTPGQYVLKQELLDGTFRTIRPDSWALGVNIPGIGVDANGKLTPGVGNSVINNTVTVGLRAILGANSYEKPVRIINANAANPAPTVSPFPDTVVTSPGEYEIDFGPGYGDVFTDTDALTVLITGGTGEALPVGISRSGTAILVAADFPNTQLAIRLQATDTAGNVVQDSFLLTVNRPVAPTRTLTSTNIVGARFINEGSTNQYRLRNNYSDGSVEDVTSQASKTLEGWRPGDNIDNEGNVTIPANQALGDGHELVIVMNRAGTRYAYPVQVVDLSQATDRPAGTENCASYGRLTDAQRDALPIVTIYEYLDTATPNQGLSYTVRPFATHDEAIAVMATKGQSGSKANYDFNRATTSSCAVGDVLYNDDRSLHIQQGTNTYWPVEAGFWGFSYTAPASGANGSYILLQTDACGNITTRETITLVAN